MVPRSLFALVGALLVGPVALPAIARAEEVVGDFVQTECPFALSDELAASETVRCGYAIVPERHDNPDGRTLRLGVAVFESTSPNPQPDPLVMAQGGPGGSMLELAPFYLEALAQTPGLRDRDIILFDQRGTRYSEPFLFCEEVYEFNLAHASEPASAVLDAEYFDAVAACRDRLVSRGIDLSAYNSLENVADIPLLVDALGYEGPFNFYGVSYATMLAQHLMRDYPDRLRSAVLDSVAPLDTSFVLHIPQNSSRALRRLFATCAADPACGAEYPDLEREFLAAVERLDREPIQVRMANVGALQEAIESGQDLAELSLDPDRFQVPVRVDGTGLVAAVNASFYASESLPRLPQAIREMRSGNYAGVLQVLPALLFSKSQADGMYSSTVCAENADFAPEDVDLAGVYPELREALQRAPLDVLDTCAEWDVEPLEDAANVPVSADVPALLLSGEFDQITPPAFGDRVAAGLRRAYHFTFPGLGHAIVGSSPCASDILADFLADPDRQPEADCLADLALDFQLPEPPDMVEIAPSAWGARTVVPEGWEPSYGGDAVWAERSERGLQTGRALAFARLPGTDPDLVRNYFPHPFRPASPTQVGDRLWFVYEVDNPAVVSVVAVTAVADRLYAVALDTDALWHRDAVLRPVLEAFEPLPPAAALPSP